MARIENGTSEAHHPRRPRLDEEDDGAGRGDRGPRHRLGLARRRDRGHERGRRARLQRPAERDGRGARRGHRIFRLRPAVLRWPRLAPGAAAIAAGASERRAREDGKRSRPPEPDLRRDAGADARSGAPDASRRDHPEAPRRALRVAAQRDLAQAQVHPAPGVRDLRLHRSRQRRCRSGQPAPGHLRAGQARIQRQRRHRLGREGRPRSARETGRARDRPSRRLRSLRSSPAAGRGARPVPSAGSSRAWSRRSRFASGRPRATSGTRCSSRCATTSRPGR